MATQITARKGGKTIVVDIDGGNVDVSAKGVKGKGCHALTDAIEKSLGKKQSSKPTAEAYQSAGAGTVRH